MTTLLYARVEELGWSRLDLELKNADEIKSTSGKQSARKLIIQTVGKKLRGETCV